ncbi:Beta-lactamase superfamily domain [Teratosphaeria destructans]|uniref:Beta-lactamase superfamily domain n=1 Tax=Teratosphaeria destructans TaxID=418781 RepID=A0A9W7VYJ0_9PEZI|nr:Beta-lactamase superfamily domain [Teratosphaeria destructans]
MAGMTTVTPAPSRRPQHGSGKEHHIGSPPTGFQNPWPSFKTLGMLSAFRMRFGNSSGKKFVPVPQGPNGTRSDELVKVLQPTWGAGQKSRLRATWIGHASFLIEFPAPKGAERGIRILCDPVFSERTSPAQWIGPKRYTPPCCTLDELPEVDVICISHNHYDHLDHASVQHVYNKQRAKPHCFAGLGNAQWFRQHVGFREDEVTDADWWDSFDIAVPGLGSIRLTCCPVQHGSGRSLNDQGKTLWCSWAMEAEGKKLYFSGDTAYQALDTPSPCPAFKEIGQTVGPFHLALLPIGLMTPASFMGSVHATPEQSLCIHKDVRSSLSIGMHYGTVRGGISAQYEDVRDPPRRWRVAAEKEDLWRGGGVEGDGTAVDTSKPGVGLCHVGETVMV